MAEPLKSRFGLDVPRALAAALKNAHHAFPDRAFLDDVGRGYEELNLMSRARRIAGALAAHLPDHYPSALKILISSLGPRREPETGMASFRFLPHVFFVSDRGLDHLDISLDAQEELTQRFTAEFGIRAFLEKHPEATLARLKKWTRHPSARVRRLVSEGSRPRLPWASRLRRFQKDPSETLALLELLKDDTSLYVRKSVANHLNDIGKDHPEILLKTAKAWRRGATPGRRWLVRHALRSLVKQGHPGALAILGFRDSGPVEVRGFVTPKRVGAGGTVRVGCRLRNPDSRRGRFLVDFKIHFVKANGAAKPKVFKLATFDLAPGEKGEAEKSVSLKEMTTRKHYAGQHRVEILVNGRAYPAGGFVLR